MFSSPLKLQAWLAVNSCSRILFLERGSEAPLLDVSLVYTDINDTQL